MAKKTGTRKPTVQIEIRESGVHGRGVYTMQFIRKGTRVIEYAGERVPWERAPDKPNDPHTFNFGLENGDVINPEIGGNDAAGSIIRAIQTAKPSRRMIASLFMPCATSKPARNCFMITECRLINRSRMQPKRNLPVTAARQTAAGTMLELKEAIG